MLSKNSNNEPCLEQTSQGVTITYNNRLLYSKYNPSKAIKQTISNLNILPNTIFLCLSPALDYGISELLNSLKEDSIILLCEIDKGLYDFEKENLNFDSDKIAFLTKEELLNLPYILHKNNYTFTCGTRLKHSGTYKRVVRIDMSAGVQFHTSFYDNLVSTSTASLLTFWANRVTLTKFGRKYSLNYFKNLQKYPDTKPIQNYFKSINKTILVCGAGQSLDSTIKTIQSQREDLYILCVDTALIPLLKNKIIPDGVFIEETQHVISKAFIGALNKNIHVFASLSSLSQITTLFPLENISFFTTIYSESDFLQNAINSNILPPANNPFGSVGLTATYYALQFRQNDDINVFVTGLDFSYSAGITHTRNASSILPRMFTSTKINPVQNYSASFSNLTEKVLDKNNNVFFTTHSLKTYANLFNDIFSNTKNLYDAGNSGLVLNLPRKSIEASENICSDNKNFYFNIDQNKISEYLKNEIKELNELKDILTGKINLPDDERELQIKKLAESREYLYMHFPDGQFFKYNQSFLNRIRTEIDYFLKYLN